MRVTNSCSVTRKGEEEDFALESLMEVSHPVRVWRDQKFERYMIIYISNVVFLLVLKNLVYREDKDSL